ncbi:chondroitin sulfate glucuronyltransferase-like [Chiloscyllium punctatum]|uniref:chondroitin sulfate glucuronyltransferase-like n=1 Tax=Chiloscyllium punctatum TaxID=137246 RepID=UPI003B638CED
MRFTSLLLFFRPALPLILGLSLGCSLSLLRVSWSQGDGHESCMDAGDSRGLPHDTSHLEPRLENGEFSDNKEYEPRIVPYYKDPNKPHKKVLRTRYIHTELGIRDRLFVGVLTSKATLNTLAISVNRTIGHHFNRLIYFTGFRNTKIPHGMQIISHGDDRPVWLMYRTIQYIYEHFGNEFDWFYLVQDNTYTQAERIKSLVSHLSIKDLYLGRAEEFIGGDPDSRYCHGGYGYVMSRSILVKLQQYLDSCRNDILSVRPDEWLGRCIIDYIGISCIDKHKDVRYRSFQLGKNTDPDKEDSTEFKKAFTVHLVPDPTLMYRLHRRFSEIELEKTYKEIEELQVMLGWKELHVIRP